VRVSESVLVVCVGFVLVCAFDLTRLASLLPSALSLVWCVVCAPGCVSLYLSVTLALLINYFLSTLKSTSGVELGFWEKRAVVVVRSCSIRGVCSLNAPNTHQPPAPAPVLQPTPVYHARPPTPRSCAVIVFVDPSASPSSLFHHPSTHTSIAPLPSPLSLLCGTACILRAPRLLFASLLLSLHHTSISYTRRPRHPLCLQHWRYYSRSW